jgi:hypothetical protein
MRKLPSIVVLFFGVLSTAVGQPTISGVNAFWWLGSGVLSDGNGCSTNSSPCYYAQASWTANPNGASGTPTWYVNTVSGGGNVSLSCTTCSSTVATSTAPSNGCVYDVSVYVHYPDGSESSHSGFEVAIVTPQTTTLLANYPADADYTGSGYISTTKWNLTDSCGSSDAGLDANEVFGMFTDDYAGNNWQHGSQSAGNQSTSTITDQQSVFQNGNNTTPPAENPQSPLTTTRVFHNPWTLYVGSLTFGSGVAVRADTQQNYQDHARHQ